MTCRDCINYQARPALGDAFGWCDHQSRAVSANEEICEHFEDADEAEAQMCKLAHLAELSVGVLLNEQEAEKYFDFLTEF